VGGVAGLMIQVRPSGAKSWILRGRYGEWQTKPNINGTSLRERKRRELGLGPYPEVLLGNARDKAREIMVKLDHGIDPVAERMAAKSAVAAAAKRGRSFKEAFEEYAIKKSSEFNGDKYRNQWRSVAERYAFPAIGNFLVQDIELSHVLDVLKPIWETKNPTATKLRQIVEGTLAYATVHGYRSGDNPARWQGNLSIVLGAPSKVSKETNYPALQAKDAARWWQDLAVPEGMGSAALRFQAMTVTRTGAIRYATWDEFDLERGVWTIQPGRQASKVSSNDKAKKVVLTEKGTAFLNALPRRANCPYVFWSPRGGFLSDATIGKVMRTIHEADVGRGGYGYIDEISKQPAVPHGLRSTFRTWISDGTNFDADMAEIALFHKVGTKVQQAYDRADMIEKRREMMLAWEAILTGQKTMSPKVIGD
jgi:integrase